MLVFVIYCVYWVWESLPQTLNLRTLVFLLWVVRKLQRARIVSGALGLPLTFHL